MPQKTSLQPEVKSGFRLVTANSVPNLIYLTYEMALKVRTLASLIKKKKTTNLIKS